MNTAEAWTTLVGKRVKTPGGTLEGNVVRAALAEHVTGMLVRGVGTPEQTVILIVDDKNKSWWSTPSNVEVVQSQQSVK